LDWRFFKGNINGGFFMSAVMKCNKCGCTFGPYGGCPKCYGKDVETIEMRSDITESNNEVSKFLKKN